MLATQYIMCAHQERGKKKLHHVLWRATLQ